MDCESTVYVAFNKINFAIKQANILLCFTVKYSVCICQARYLKVIQNNSILPFNLKH